MEDNEEDNNEYYQLPENSDQSIRNMAWGLLGFFGFLVVVVMLVVVNAQSIARQIPFEAEQRFIRPYEAAIKKWFPDKSDPEIEAYLQALADQISATMEMPENYQVSVHYIDVDVENAFASLGGHVFIFKGLLDEMPDENSLTMVLAHELAHIKNRDPVAAMGRGLAIQMLYGFITNDYSSSVDILTASGEVGMSFFSRQQETAADVEAVTALYGHYGHVAGYDDFFARMRDQLEDEDQPQELPEWLSTHPDLSKRIDYLSQHIKELGYRQGKVTPIPEHVIAILEEEY